MIFHPCPVIIVNFVVKIRVQLPSAISPGLISHCNEANDEATHQLPLDSLPSCHLACLSSHPYCDALKDAVGGSAERRGVSRSAPVQLVPLS